MNIKIPNTRSNMSRIKNEIQWKPNYTIQEHRILSELRYMIKRLVELSDKRVIVQSNYYNSTGSTSKYVQSQNYNKTRRIIMKNIRLLIANDLTTTFPH